MILNQSMDAMQEEIQQLADDLSTLAKILDKLKLENHVLETLDIKTMDIQTARELLIKAIDQALFLGVDPDILVQFLPDKILEDGWLSPEDRQELGLPLVR